MENKDIEYTNIIVFSGAPSSGKSTTAEKMRERGYVLRDVEVAREYIETLKQQLRTAFPEDTDEQILEKFGDIARKPEFSNTILQKKLMYEASLNDASMTIIDSSLACGMAYPALFNFKVDSGLEREIAQRLKTYRYRIIFSFEMLALVEDGVRYENNDERARLHLALRRQYEALGYHYICVPSMRIEDQELSLEERVSQSVMMRVNFIIDMIKSITSKPELMVGTGRKLFSNADQANRCLFFSQSSGYREQQYADFSNRSCTQSMRADR